MINIYELALAIGIPVIVAIIIAYYSIKKNLSCIIVTLSSLIPIPKEFQGKAKIIYGNTTVKNLSSTIIKIKNSGLSYIDDGMFVNPLQIVFDEDVKLLEYEILERSKPDRDTKISIKDNIATIEKITLLNKFESIIIRFIHDGIQKNKKPIVGDIKDYKIIQMTGAVKGKTEAFFILFDGVFFTLMSIMGMLISIPLLYYFIVSGDFSFGKNIVLSMIIIIGFISIFMMIRGIKKLYYYLACVIEIKEQGDVQNE